MHTNVLKKAIKIAGLTCAALSGAALIASGAALKALTEGAKFLTASVRTILDESSVSAEADSELLRKQIFQPHKKHPGSKEPGYRC